MKDMRETSTILPATALAFLDLLLCTFQLPVNYKYKLDSYVIKDRFMMSARKSKRSEKKGMKYKKSIHT